MALLESDENLGGETCLKEVRHVGHAHVGLYLGLSGSFPLCHLAAPRGGTASAAHSWRRDVSASSRAHGDAAGQPWTAAGSQNEPFLLSFRCFPRYLVRDGSRQTIELRGSRKHILHPLESGRTQSAAFTLTSHLETFL